MDMNENKDEYENMKMNCINIIKDYYFDKGFYNTEVSVEETKDTSTTRNDVNLIFNIERGEKEPSISILIRIALALKVDEKELYKIHY